MSFAIQQTEIANRLIFCLKRITACVYDCCILICVLILYTLLLLLFNDLKPITPGNLLYSSSLFLIIGGYFITSWCLSGQTIGMKAWRLKLIDSSSSNISIPKGIGRFVFSFCTLGIGTLWMLLDKEGRTLDERLTHCAVIQTS